MLGLGASMLLFYAMFVLLAGPHTPRRSLWSGALLGALGVRGAQADLRAGCSARPRASPAFQAFGIALIVLIWINYFSRVVLYAAAWAHTASAARAGGPTGPPPPSRARRLRRCADPGGVEQAWATPYLAGAVTMLGLDRRRTQAQQEEDMKLEREHGWLLRKTPK